MDVLDESIVAQQCDQLRHWRIPFRQVGADLSAYGTSDENLIPVLHRLPQPTFFSHDGDFFKASLCQLLRGLRIALFLLNTFAGVFADSARKHFEPSASGCVARVSMGVGVITRAATVADME